MAKVKEEEEEGAGGGREDDIRRKLARRVIVKGPASPTCHRSKTRRWAEGKLNGNKLIEKEDFSREKVVFVEQGRAAKLRRQGDTDHAQALTTAAKVHGSAGYSSRRRRDPSLPIVVQ